MWADVSANVRKAASRSQMAVTRVTECRYVRAELKQRFEEPEDHEITSLSNTTGLLGE